MSSNMELNSMLIFDWGAKRRLFLTYKNWASEASHSDAVRYEFENDVRYMYS